MSITQTILDQLGLNKTVLTVLKWVLIAGLLAASHTAVYMKGRSDVEAKYAAATVEQLETDIVENAERIERQVTELTDELASSRAQNRKLQEAIDANQAANDDPACALSDDEFRLFNDAVSETQRGVPDGGLGTLRSAKSVEEPERRGAKDKIE